MTRLLIITTGHTDVQLVVHDESDAKRQELEGKKHGVGIGQLHDQIAQRSWRVVDVPTQKDKDKASTLPDGDLTLCTPKLDAVLNYFTNELHDLPSAVIIFETRRTITSDPRFAGQILERRLHDKGISDVQHCTFLEGQEKLEDPTNDVDAIVRRSVVAILLKSIANVIENVNPTEIFVATTGGLAAANMVIEDSTRLFAVANGATVKVLEVPDSNAAKDRRGSEDRAVEEKFHPATGYRARWQALSLIQKGNLLGAWGAVASIKEAPGQKWVEVVEWLAHFASSLPMPAQCDIPVLTHERMAVRAALRVELALRAGDIPRAVHGTVAFFEAALWDWLRQRDFAREDQASGNLETGFTFIQKPIDEKANRFYNRGGIAIWKIDDFKKGVIAWLNVLNRPALCALHNAISDDIRNLRNDVAHNEPTPQLMDSARKEMQRAGLWSATDPSTFLSQPLVQNVLEELGVNQPESLCRTLLDMVRERLLAS